MQKAPREGKLLDLIFQAYQASILRLYILKGLVFVIVDKDLYGFSSTGNKLIVTDYDWAVEAYQGIDDIVLGQLFTTLANRQDLAVNNVKYRLLMVMGGVKACAMMDGSFSSFST